jgi:mono/diheme cytochrome c family protein
MTRTILSTALFAASLLATTRAPANDATPGRAAYLRYCSACHGGDGKGEGVAATVLRPKPTDLTQLAAANGGKFPRARVQESIDGRTRIAAHGDTAMPVWGQIFMEEKGSTTSAAAEVRGQVQLITDYIESIQALRPRATD